MGEWLGVAIALASSSLGGTAAAITRYLVGGADPILLAILRWGIGFLCLLPCALMLGVRWPQRPDWPAVAALGVCFFGLFFILYNIAVSYTTAARASLALATLPLHTMVVGALLGVERLTARKITGVGIAVLGVAAALAAGLAHSPPGAWRGELIMTGAVFCMAFYNVLSRPLMQRSSALGFLTVGMGAGAVVLVLVGLVKGSFAALDHFTSAQWIAGIYLGIGGGALAFILWVMALARATPTRVANTMTVNPIAATLLAALLIGEPITPNLLLGLVAVFAGIWIATSEAKPA
ncbi:EamA family transporter [Bradyrhizobium sp. AC87j1]|uniref:DMT family transporter n=1 Tax=Bradyrhizobium sp. AC87j1 TaxID=2055894 RepID=UPI000CEC2CB4|nr:DMT family transporter [Bradyrhizobium sp. AC87j1]PPQ17900.1 EamA family transporter [Bradyrhizobium sp. AC87j1]